MTDSTAETPPAGTNVLALLERAFGPFAGSRPDQWERRVQLLLVGLIHERVVRDYNEMDVDELITLAKILTETKRLPTRTSPGRDHAPESEDQQSESRGPGLPRHVADVVRQVYGLEPAEVDSLHPK